MKRKMKFLKVTSLVMSFVLLLLIFPLGVFAQEQNAEENPVLTEAVELREENVKHFLNPDGSYTALVYNNAVHRKDENGAWQDIDNTMSENVVKNKQAYITSDERAIFSKKINSDDNEIYTLSENGYTIKLFFVDDELKNTTAKLSNHAEKYTPSSTDNIDTQYKKLKEIGTDTTILYKNAIKGIDLEYVLSVNDVKENIIVNKLQDEYTYTFVYELVGLEAMLNGDGSITLSDNQSNEEKYVIPAPYMYDADGAVSYDVHYSLTMLDKGKYELTVSADKDWINSDERTLPVTIDPTITQYASPFDTYIDSSNPDVNYGNHRKMYVGTTYTVYMKPSGLSTLVDDATVTNVTLNVYYFYFSSITSGNVVIDIYPVAVPWNELTWTYNMANQYTNFGLTNTVIDSAILPASTNVNENAPGLVAFDITELYLSAYAGTPFYGMALKYNSGSLSSVGILSGETGTDIRAYYELTYVKDAPIANGTYYIENALDEGRFITHDYFISGMGFDHKIKQKWEIEYLHNGYYKITEPDYGEAITVPDTQINVSSAFLVSDEYSALETQQWKIYDVGNGMYNLSPRSNEGVFFVTLGGGSGEDLIQKELQSTLYDEWYLEKIKDVNAPLEGQESNVWCWAATSRMFARYYYSSVNLTQSQAVTYVKGFEALAGGNLEDSQMAINYYISNISGASIETEIKEHEIYSEEVLVNFINSYHVVYISRGKYLDMSNPNSRDNGHVLLICGYVTKGSEILFIINDSEPVGEGSIYLLSYEELCYQPDLANSTAYTYEGYIWDGCIVKSTSISDQTIPYYFEQ